MDLAPLGHTGISVSRISLGTMTFGHQNDRADGFAQMDAAVAAGVNFIDTAEMYPVPSRAPTAGSTETIVGEWLAARRNRAEVVLATKITGPGPAHIRGGAPAFDRAQIRTALDGSLKRLNTDYVDLYYLHWPERPTNYFGRLGYQPSDADFTPLAETLAALADEIKAGRIRHVGISNETPWGFMTYLRLAEQAGLPRPAAIQNPYSLVNRTFEIGLAEISDREACGLCAYSPLAFGVLSGKYLGGRQPAGARLTLYPVFQRYSHPRVQAATAAYVALARDHGLDPSQMAIAYLLGKRYVTSVILGATTMDQLETDLQAATLRLPSAVIEGIEAIHGSDPNPAP